MRLQKSRRHASVSRNNADYNTDELLKLCEPDNEAKLKQVMKQKQSRLFTNKRPSLNHSIVLDAHSANSKYEQFKQKNGYISPKINRRKSSAI